MTIALIDYGAGNMTSVIRGLRRAGLDPVIPSAPEALADVSGIVVPGVGHFAATSALSADWREALLARVQAGVPLLGICLGMQWLFDDSTEAVGVPGLGVLEGTCAQLDGAAVKVPHLGWNTLTPTGTSRLLDGIDTGAFAYFAHSYAAPVGPHTAATTTHGSSFASVVERDNVFGAQFHPELSAQVGERLLANFARIVSQ